MGLRDLIFEKSGDDKKKPKKENKEEVMSFPTKNENAFEGGNASTFIADEAGQFQTPGMGIMGEGTSAPLSCEPHIDAVVSLYEKGFDALNQDGYDFYEYYKAVLEAGADNPAIYKMALTMAKAMDPNVSKTSLVKQSEFYLTKIIDTYKEYVKIGNQKKLDIENQKSAEESSLQTELQGVQSQLKQLQQKENSLKIQIGAIDNKYATQIHEISCKLEANDTAKREIFESINKVKRGINANL